MKKKIAIMLATVATLATIFTGCGEKDVSGDYTATMTVADFMDDDDVKTMSDMGVDISGITVDVTLNLTSEKEFEMSFDTTSFKEQFKTLVNDNMDAIIDSALQQSGISRDQITDEVAKFSGYDSADALFAELKDEMTQELDKSLDSMDDELAKYTVTGSYKVSKDKVIFTSKDDNDSIVFDTGAIQDDGSIKVDTEDDNGKQFTMLFVPKASK